MRLTTAIIIVIGTAACAPQAAQRRRPDDTPRVEAFGATAAAVGDPLEIYGSTFVDPSEGWVDVRWRGHFLPADGGASEEVDFTVPLASNGDGVLVWERFGSYRVPFGSGTEIGVFEGRVSAVNRYFDGSYTEQPEDEALLVRFEVLPSIVVTDFRAMGETWYADCAEPATSILHGLPYAMRAIAVGFEPENVEWVIGEGLLVEGDAARETTRISHAWEGDDQGLLVRFAPVPAHTDGYTSSISVRARGSDGSMHQLDFPFTVRDPLQVFFTTPMMVAELYEPEPVSGCIPGGPASVSTAYSESRTETRTRSIQHGFTRGWTRTVGESHQESYGASLATGTTETEGRTTTVSDATQVGGREVVTDSLTSTRGRTATTSVSFTEADSSSFGWSVGRGSSSSDSTSVGGSVTVGAEASGEAGIPLVANGKVGGHVDVTAQGSRGWVTGTSEESGLEGETERTETTQRGASVADMTSVSESRARASESNWSRTRTYAEANSYSVARSVQATRSYGEALTRSASVAESLSESVSETLSVSSSESRSLAVAAHVWAGQYGTWYRQTTRLVRYGVVVAHDLCGNGEEVGQIVVDDWTWAPDLAIGESCPPETNLPPAECRIAPCSGYRD